MMLAAAATVALASPAPRRPASCPTEMGHALEVVRPQLPAGARPTRDALLLLFDIGSDGRVRRVAVGQSSGDAAVDLAAADAIAHSSFVAPSYRCVSVSTGVSETLHLPPIPTPEPDDVVPLPDLKASPTPVPSAMPPAPSASSEPQACGAFVRVVRLAAPRLREPAGTANVDVGLDAHAHVTAVRLARSSGNKRTDYAAAVTARTSEYAYLAQPGCPPTATTYRVELTFR